MSDPKAVTIWSKVEGVDALAELALNLHWSWNHATDQLWEALDSELWEETQNPWVILQTVSKDKIQAALAIPKFRQRLDDLLHQNRKSYTEDAWFQKKHKGSPLSLAAYFSMEFMLTEALPIYSGGLGNVAGDQMKAASDLGVPVVGVGLLRRAAAGTLPHQRPGPTAHPPASRSEWRMVTVADSIARIEDPAALLGSLGGKRKALPAR
jgi:starch phosphorylase